MIKYSEAEKVFVERIKKIEVGVICDRCGKEIIAKDHPDCSDWSTQKYFNVTTGHDDWGRDSWESRRNLDICQDCILDFVSDYLKDTKSSVTAYIEINSDISYPRSEWEENADDRGL